MVMVMIWSPGEEGLMAVMPVPRRERKLDAILRERGGVRAYVRDELRQGQHVEDVAKRLSALLVADGEKTMSGWTLYDWLRRWRADEAGKEAVA